MKNDKIIKSIYSDNKTLENKYKSISKLIQNFFDKSPINILIKKWKIIYFQKKF